MQQETNNRIDPLSAIRLFISSTFVDMQPERDCFNDILVPRLRALCRDRGVSFFSVDLRWGVTVEDIANDRLIPRCLSEVDKCRPFFLGIIGGRYGSQMNAIPQNLLAEYPWLEDKKGISFTELEITYHFLKNPTGDNSLFLFKDCEFVGDESEWQSMQQLKEYIQKMAPGRVRCYRTLEDFRNIILQEFEKWLVEMYGQTDIHLERELLFSRENDSHVTKNTDEEESIDRCIRQTSAAIMLHGKGPLGKTAILNHISKQFDHKIIVNCHADDANVYWPYVVFSIYKKIAALNFLAPEQMKWFQEQEERFQHGLLLSVEEEEQLKTAFLKLLSDARWQSSTLLVVNDLESIQGRQNKYLQWLPAEPPAGLHIVCSTNDADILNSAKIMGWNLVELRPMEKNTAHTILERELEKLGKSADDACALLESPLAGYPGYLKTSIDVLNAFCSFDAIAPMAEKLASAQDFFQFYRIIFEEIEARYGVSSAEDLRLVLAAMGMSALPLSEDGRYHVLHAICKTEKMQWSGVSDVLDSLRFVNLSGSISSALQEYIMQTVSPVKKECIHQALGQYWYAVAQTPQGIDTACLRAALNHFTNGKQVAQILEVLSDVLTVKALCIYDSDCLRRALAAVMFYSDRNVGKQILSWILEMINRSPKEDAGFTCAIKQLHDIYWDLGLVKDEKRMEQLLDRAEEQQLLHEDIRKKQILEATKIWVREAAQGENAEAVFADLEQQINDPDTPLSYKVQFSLLKAELKSRYRYNTVLNDIDEALQLSVKAASVSDVLAAYEEKITALTWKCQYDDAMKLAQDVMQWAWDMGYLGCFLACAQQKIVCLYRTGKYDLALEESKKYLALCSRWGMSDNVAVMNYNIAIVHNLAEQYEACIAHTKACLKDKTLSSQRRIMLLDVQKAAYYNDGKHDLAIQSIKQALNEPKLSEHKRLMLCLALAANLLQKGESYQSKAIAEMSKAFTLLQKRNNWEPISVCLNSFFPMLVTTKEGKSFWRQWKDILEQEGIFYQQGGDQTEEMLNGAFFAATIDSPAVSRSTKKLKDTHRIALERNDHTRAAESAYDLGVLYAQYDLQQSISFYLTSAEAFRAAGLCEKEQEASLAALRSLIQNGTVTDRSSYQQALTHLDEISAELVTKWVSAGTMLQNEQVQNAYEILKTIVSAGLDYKKIILLCVSDLSTQMVACLQISEMEELAALANAHGIDDTIFMRLFHSSIGQALELYEFVAGKDHIAKLKAENPELTSIISASPYFTIVGGMDWKKLSPELPNRESFMVQPRYKCKHLDRIKASVFRMPSDKGIALVCITDAVFRSMTKEQDAAVKQYVADNAASRSYRLEYHHNEMVRCNAILRGEDFAAICANYVEHTKYLLRVIKDLDKLAGEPM